MNKLIAACALCLALGYGASASAASQTFDITWSGAAYGDSATATGMITLDTAALPAVTPCCNNVNLPDPSVTAFRITIRGASMGNGTFGLSDFTSITFWTPAPLDLTKELIGQDLGNGCTFGEVSFPCGLANAGDFNFGSFGGPNPKAPNGDFFFLLGTKLSNGDPMQVTSILPVAVRGAVPEPASWALTMCGLGLAGAALRRRRQAAAAA